MSGLLTRAVAVHAVTPAKVSPLTTRMLDSMAIGLMRLGDWVEGIWKKRVGRAEPLLLNPVANSPTAVLTDSLQNQTWTVLLDANSRVCAITRAGVEIRVYQKNELYKSPTVKPIYGYTLILLNGRPFESDMIYSYLLDEAVDACIARADVQGCLAGIVRAALKERVG